MFCKYCGKELIEGRACDCQGTRAISGGQQSQQQIQYTAPPQYQPQQQSQYTQPPQYQPQQPQYYNQPQQYNNSPLVVRQPNGIAKAGFVFALIGLFISFVPVLGWIIWILGLIFSIVGIATSGRKGGTGRGLAIAGLIISCIDLILLIILVAGAGTLIGLSLL